MREARLQMFEGRAMHLIYSGCYTGDAMETELRLRRKIIDDYVEDQNITEIEGITKTKDELRKLKSILDELGAKSILFISDQWHMPRLVHKARKLMPDIEIFYISVIPYKYQFAWEPNPIKIIRSGIKPMWIIWNWLLRWIGF